MDSIGGRRVALVHDWLTGMRGGEKCLERMCGLFPDAPIYTLFRRRGSVVPVIEDRTIRTSLLRYLPAVHRYYRYLLPLFPTAAQWPICDCDLVFSLSHCVAKSAVRPAGVPHVCYCFSPMRYAWHMQESYFGGNQFSPRRWLIKQILRRMREWDRATADRVTHFIAISKTVQQRIRDCYARPSHVIYPPVDAEFYTPARIIRESYYLVVSAFAPYKRLDLAVEACNRLKRDLVVIGSGQEERKLRALAGPTVRFLGWQPNESIREHLRTCRALLFPGEEDFGIVPVEAQACGTPVIAFGRGGASETVVPTGRGHEPTGIWFEDQSVGCLAEAITELERKTGHFNPAAARAQALKFSASRFDAEILAYIENILGRKLARAA